MTRQTATAPQSPDTALLRPRRFHIRLGLLLLSAVLASAAFAPFGQFYLAWVALVPWLLALRGVRSLAAAFAFGTLGGVLFNLITFSWLWRATIPGTVGVSCYLGLFWGLAAFIVVLLGLVDLEVPKSGRRLALAAVLLATIWASNEWLRGWVLGGFPWAFLSQTQTPILPMVQIADITGSYGVTFWVVLINAVVFFACVHPWRRVMPAAALMIVLLLAAGGYGCFRIWQTHPTPGPLVMVVQSNHPHERGGKKTVTQEEQIDFHLRTTRAALSGNPVDLVAWSETVMPGLNPEARNEPGLAAAEFLRRTHEALADLAKDSHVALVTGAYYVGGWRGAVGSRRATDIRNSVFLYDRAGRQSADRYDKIHLVPFAEFLPFRESAPRIYAVLRWFAAYSVDYPIIAASPDAVTVFHLEAGGPKTYRFVTPICFEDADAALVARMFRPQAGGGKRADFIVNITNDGWFRGIEQAQHLQGAILRSIENRVPTARAANTGISGFIDSCGRTVNLLPGSTQGTSQRKLELDGRLSFYTRHGDVFGVACTIASAVLLPAGLLKRFQRSQP